MRLKGILTSRELYSESRSPNHPRINVTSYPVLYTQVLRVPPGKQISIARRFADGGPFHAQEWIARQVCCLSIHPSGKSFLLHCCTKRQYPNCFQLLRHSFSAARFCSAVRSFPLRTRI